MFQLEATPLGNRPHTCRCCCRIPRWRAHAIQRRCPKVRSLPSKRWRPNARNVVSDSTKLAAFHPPVASSRNFVLSRGEYSWPGLGFTNLVFPRPHIVLLVVI